MLVLKAGIIGILAGMAYQDFRYRGIYWWMFPILAILFGFHTLHSTNLKSMVSAATSSCLFIGVQLLILTIYLSLKRSRMINIFSGFFGLGDFLFLVAISVGFSFLNFVVFYMTSLLLVVLWSLVSPNKSEGQANKIPLAGYQALLLGGVLLIDWRVANFSLHADEFLNNLLVYGN
jgi:hypothetical protein